MEWIVEAETLGDLVDGLWTGGKKLVRCKDCKWRTDLEHTAWHPCDEVAVNDNWYCAYGERKDDEKSNV